MQRPIAVLDSGVGGLTVVKELLKQLPREEIVYFGDTLRAPYGPRSKDEVMQFTEEVVQYLLKYDPKLVVIACNTATAVALEHIRASLSIPVIGVIEPGARAALRGTKTGYIGVIGTEGTIKSKAYDQALYQLADDIQIVSEACPAFVPLVEKGEYESAKAYKIVYESIVHMRSYPIDCLILGCTHYPFLADTIAEVMGESVTLIHSAEETTTEVIAILEKQGQYEQTEGHIDHEAIVTTSQFTSGSVDNESVIANTKIKKHCFICSGDPTTFQTIVRQWLADELHQYEPEWKSSVNNSHIL